MSRFDSPLDEGMQQAMEHARGTFGYFWRELHWEYRRIVPATTFSAVKAAFSDPEAPVGQEENGREASAGKLQEVDVEQMWINEVHFDGHSVFGKLLNTPNELTSVKQGDSVQLPLERISDWMIGILDDVYGGFTVQQIRKNMTAEERAEHDAMWGLSFGDPNTTALPNEGIEHPMSENMAVKLREHLEADPEAVNQVDEQGSTLLHSMALGGAGACVEVLLEAGADPSQVNGHGDTARDLAMCLGWDRIVERLK